jgi:TolB-like protein
MNIGAEETTLTVKLNVAVSTLDGRGLAEGEASTLTDALSNYLANTSKFRVMERGRMDLILKEQGFQQSGACNDAACIVEMGQLLGVDHMVTGSIGKVGQTFSMNLRVINVATGEIVRSLNRYYKGEIDGILTEILPNVASELAGDKAEEKTTALEKKIETPIVTNDKIEKDEGKSLNKRFGIGISFLNTLGESIELSSERNNYLENFAVPSVFLSFRALKRLELNVGVSFYDSYYKLLGVSGDVIYSNYGTTYSDGRIDVTFESEDGPGIYYGLGFIFNPSSRIALSVNSNIAHYFVNVKGELKLPNMTLVPLNIFGHDDENSPDKSSTITVFSSYLKAEWSIVKQLSLSLGLGFTFCEESWEFSDGYRTWVASGLIQRQPNEDYSFSIKGMAISTMLNWYWF